VLRMHDGVTFAEHERLLHYEVDRKPAGQLAKKDNTAPTSDATQNRRSEG
jgi:hypothetical protein